MYQRSAADVKAEVLAAARRREQESVRLDTTQVSGREHRGLGRHGRMAFATSLELLPLVPFMSSRAMHLACSKAAYKLINQLLPPAV